MFKNGLINGSIMNTAQSPNTTDGIAAKSSTIIPITSLKYLGIIFSVINIAVPTPNGIAIINEANYAFRLNMYMFDEIQGSASKSFLRLALSYLGSFVKEMTVSKRYR